jgi:hypothetical protein
MKPKKDEAKTANDANIKEIDALTLELIIRVRKTKIITADKYPEIGKPRNLKLKYPSTRIRT